MVPPLVSAKVPVVPAPIGRPVALVRVPDDGVPRAPLKVTKAPAEPTLTASAVATPVPKPEIPVDTGRPVALVKVAAEGVPKFGVVKTGLVVYATTPVPDSSLKIAASLADVLIEEVARKPRVEVADQVGTPPTTERMLPVLPIVRFPNVFAAVA